MVTLCIAAQGKKRPTTFVFARKFWVSSSGILGTVVQGPKRSERGLLPVAVGVAIQEENGEEILLERKLH